MADTSPQSEQNQDLSTKKTNNPSISLSPNMPSAGVTALCTFHGDPGTVTSVAWSPDGSLLASSNDNNTVRLWRSHAEPWLYGYYNYTTFSTGPESATSVVWSPDGSLLAFISHDCTIHIWDPHIKRPLHILDGHLYLTTSIAWSPDSALLASASHDETARIWNPHTGSPLHTFHDQSQVVRSVAWSPNGSFISASTDHTIHIWNPYAGYLLHTLHGHSRTVWTVAWSPDSSLLASASTDHTVRIWNPYTGFPIHTLHGHSHRVWTIAWSPDGSLLASASYDETVCIWNPHTGSLLHTLYGHSYAVQSVSWSSDGLFLASSSASFSSNAGKESRPDGTEVRIWRTDTWEQIGVLTHLNSYSHNIIAWHPHLPLLATSGKQAEDIIIWHLDVKHLIKAGPSPEMVHYSNAKVVLAGDSGVGKSGLSLVLTKQPYAPTESTHGRHIGLLDQYEVEQAGRPREKREVWLWDLAGQQDYRLIHQLHLHEATVALIVFDAARDTDPFAGIHHWHRALRQAQQNRGSIPLAIFLVAARIDRGGRSVSRARIEKLAQDLGCIGYIETSAKAGQGIEELGQAIHDSIDWALLPKVTSTKLLQSMKDFMLGEQQAGRLLRSEDDLYEAFLHSDAVHVANETLRQQFKTALGRLAAQGEIHKLGFGDLILLQPERLDDYASALLIAVKKEPDGLGSITETRVQQGDFPILQEERLTNPTQEKLLLIAMIDELVSNQLALREGGFLLFPSQSTREYPEAGTLKNRLSITFTFVGPVLSIYTTLVVRLAQSGIFEKEDLWRHVATYKTRLGGGYGLLLTPRGEEQAELGLFFDEETHEEMRFYFEDFVLRHIERQTGMQHVQRRRNFICTNAMCGEVLPESQVSKRLARGLNTIRCGACDTEVSLLDGEERLNGSLNTQEVKAMEQAADDQRKRESAKSILQGKIATQDFDVFLCHNGQDKTTVKQIGKLLKEQGILPWLDEWEQRPGLPWQRTLERQIEKIKTVAVCVGKNGLGPWQPLEIEAFLREFVRRDCPVIPVLLPEAPSTEQPPLPLFLQGMTWVDFRVQQPDPLEQLIWGITGQRNTDDDI